MNNVLYVNQKGEFVSHSSYSARDTFAYCPTKFFSTRVEGYTERDMRAAMHFGLSIENAVQWHVEHGYEGGPQAFRLDWQNRLEQPGAKNWVYSDVEESWANLLDIGTEMQQLFALRVKRWPYPPSTRFQYSIRRELWPGTQLAGIFNKARIDALALVRGDHPALVQIPNPPAERYVITDIKTAATAMPRSIIALDKQLREYGWMGGDIPDVALNWFEKKGRGFQKGDRAALLIDVKGTAETWNAGWDVTVCWADNKAGIIHCAGTPAAFERYKASVVDLSGKALERAKLFFSADDKDALTLPMLAATKQRVDFAAGRINPAHFPNIGATVSQETAIMLQAHKNNFYPMTGGIRYPSQKCNTCFLRGRCGGDEELHNKLAVISGEEWLDEKDFDGE